MYIVYLKERTLFLKYESANIFKNFLFNLVSMKRKGYRELWLFPHTSSSIWMLGLVWTLCISLVQNIGLGHMEPGTAVVFISGSLSYDSL
jgi:hypothetical protein